MHVGWDRVLHDHPRVMRSLQQSPSPLGLEVLTGLIVAWLLLGCGEIVLGDPCSSRDAVHLQSLSSMGNLVVACLGIDDVASIWLVIIFVAV